MIRCPKCNAENPDGSKFCSSCGCPLNGAGHQGNTDPTTDPHQIARQGLHSAPEQPKKKPFYKRAWFIVLIVLVVLTIIGAAAGGGNTNTSSNAGTANDSSSTSSSNSSTSSSSSSSSGSSDSSSSSSSSSATSSKKTLADILSSYGTFEPVTVSGSGDDVVEIPCAGVPCLMEIDHVGSSNFIVETVTASGDTVDLLVNEIGNYSGVVTDWSKYETASVLSIKADGDWTVTFSPMSSVHMAQNGETFAGPNVVGIDVDKISKVKFAHDGSSNFVVYGIGTSSAKLLVNEIGAYDGTVVWNQPQSFFIVEADGNWTISW